MQLGLSQGQTDMYSDKRIEKLKIKYPVLTFSVYKILKGYGLKDLEIKRMYQIGNVPFQFFKNNHVTVLGEIEWN